MDILPKLLTRKPCLYLVSEFSDHKQLQLIKDFASYEQNLDIKNILLTLITEG